MWKVAIGLIVGFVIGAACRLFDIPVPSPPKLVGALLVVAMTLGYAATDSWMSSRGKTASEAMPYCGGPTGETSQPAKHS